MVKSEGFTIIDATLDIEEQQNMMREKITPLLSKKPQTQTITMKNNENAKRK
jgi:hypothetical protein